MFDILKDEDIVLTTEICKTNEIKRLLLIQSLKHWFDMRRFVRTQPKNFSVSTDKMCMKIGQTWKSTYCPLCIIYCHSPLFHHDCRHCPIDESHINCSTPNSAWFHVAKADTWGGWLQASIKMVRLLWSLIKKYEDE